MAKEKTEEPRENLKDKVVYQWESETVSNTKSFWWFFGVIILTLGAGTYFFLSRDWFLIGVTVIVVPILFWYVGSQKKKESYKITPLGVYVGETLYPFNDIHSFWIVYNQKTTVLYFDFLKRYLPALVLDLKNADPVLLRAMLKKILPEQEKRGESILDGIVRLLGL